MEQLDPAGYRQAGPSARNADSGLLDIIPAAAGPRAISPMGGAVYSRRPPGSQTFLAEEHFFGVMLAPLPGIRAAFGSDRLREFDAPRGMIVVSPALYDSRLIWPALRENAVVALKRARLDALAAEEFGLVDVELRPPPFETVDPAALHIAELLTAELRRASLSSELYVDSLLTAFAVHVLRHYSNARAAPPRPNGGLSAPAAKLLEDFLEENFARRLTIAELAAVCGLSPGHFIRAFTRSFGQPPHRYLVGRRLDFAERLLAESGMSIVEIAVHSGFSSQSHLTALMRKYRHTTPAQLRRRGR